MMNRVLLILIILITSCKEKKSFADDIVLNFPKSEKLTFQNFNEGINESGSGIIYIGKPKNNIKVKYYQSMIPAPPPPPDYPIDSSYLINNKVLDNYFHGKFKRMKYSNKPISFDSLSENNIQIVVKPHDTIAKYAYNNETETIKKYKAFPVFIKNISGRKLLLTEFKTFPLVILNAKNKWQMIWNDNAYVCGDSRWEYHYWEFEPNEIMIISTNYLTGKDDGKFKIWTGNSSSTEFTMKYDKSVINKQRRIFELDK